MLKHPDGFDPQALQAAHPAWTWVVRRIEQCPEPFLADPKRAGLDLLAQNPLPTGQNRARLKLWCPRPERLWLFFYKDARIPGSDDRFSYGVLPLLGENSWEETLQAAIAYLVSGLDPAQRPPTLRRSLPFTVPR